MVWFICTVSLELAVQQQEMKQELSLNANAEAAGKPDVWVNVCMSHFPLPRLTDSAHSVKLHFILPLPAVWACPSQHFFSVVVMILNTYLRDTIRLDISPVIYATFSVSIAK